jgi:ABC-2 type transport system permease protein
VSVVAPAASTVRHSSAASVRRVAAVARAELLLLRRNPMALVTVALMPAVMVLLFRASVPAEPAGRGVGPSLLTSLIGATLLLVVYYNLVGALVARREELVLKRLRAGELGDGEILAGVVMPAVAIAWGQLAVGAVAAALAVGLPRPVNPVLVLLALTGGTATFALLAVASTALTRTVQLAELTTTPLLVASLTLSGLLFPLEQLPAPLQDLARILPLTPVVDLLRLGLAGTAPDGTALGAAATWRPGMVAAGVLAAWVAVGCCLSRRYFRWEPRR